MTSTTMQQALVAVLAALALVATPLSTLAHTPEKAPGDPVSLWADDARQSDLRDELLLPQGVLDGFPADTHPFDNGHHPLSSGQANQPLASTQPAIPCSSLEASGCELWSDRPGHGGTGIAHSLLHRWVGEDSVKVSPDGGTVYAIGWDEVPSHVEILHGLPSNVWTVVSWDAMTGEERWSASFPGDLKTTEWDTALSPNALEVSPDGEQVFVTGAPFGEASSTDAVVVALDAMTGTEQWVWRFDGAANDGDVGVDLGTSPDGTTVFVTGTTMNRIDGNAVWNALTAGIDAETGAEQWVAIHEGPYWLTAATRLAVGPGGEQIYVSGYQLTEPGRWSDYLTLSYDAATGEKLWTSTYDGPATASLTGIDRPSGVEISPDGATVFVSGWSQGEEADRFKIHSGAEFATVAYDAATGEELWLARSDLSDLDGLRDVAYGSSIDLDPDGEFVYVAGLAGPESLHTMGTLIVAYSAATGEEAWKTWHERLEGDNVPSALKVSPDGDRLYVGQESRSDNCHPFGLVLLQGWCQAFTPRDASMTTTAFDAATGEKAWEVDYGTPGLHDGAFDLAISPNGSTVYTMGWSQKLTVKSPLSNHYEMAIAAYNADGQAIVPSSGGGLLG